MATMEQNADTAPAAHNEQLPERTKKEKKVKNDMKDNAKKAKHAPSKKIEGAAMIGIDVAKEENLADWYAQVLRKGEMISYYDISGCYILEPSSYAIWENIQAWFNKKIKSIGVRNAYFPIFISEANLKREEQHLEGFAAEVAWVTHGGKEKLAQRIAIRPTSETAMYGHFATKIRSHNDLPLKLNQWNNVVRWEFKNPMPFIRSREFLWQEGHTAHLTKEEATKEVLQILEWYAGIYEYLLAVPVVKGVKTNAEKFPGAEFTTTIEGFIPSTGRGIQAGTSHCLGQHFSKMFNITVEDPVLSETGEKRPPIHVWQNSWGLTTRSIGVMILTHGDNQGLVVPPRVAEVQVVIIPVGVTNKTTTEQKQKLYKEAEAIAEVLREADVRVQLDLREQYTTGWKFNDWELKGVPLRIEFGPKDSEKHVVTTARRDQALQKTKGTVQISQLGTDIPALLEEMQADMLKKADDEYRSHRKVIKDWADFVPALNAKNVCLIPHCLDEDAEGKDQGGKCEDHIKEISARKDTGDELAVDAKAPSMGAKSLCIPYEQPEEIPAGTKCLNPDCQNMAKKWVMFGRSY